MRVHCKHLVNHEAVLGLIFLAVSGIFPGFSQVPTQARQLIVAVGNDWGSTKATLQCWQRDSAGSAWEPAFKNAWTVNLGRKGMAWGRGVFSPGAAEGEEIAWK